MDLLTSEKALIFRITHLANVPWILENGLHCRSSQIHDPGFREIGNPDLIGKRANRMVPIEPGGTLSDYVPFYFTPLTPMLLNIKTGYNGMRQTPMPEIVTFVSSVRRLEELAIPIVLSDRHAYLQAAVFSSGSRGLEHIDWPLLQKRDFKRSPDDPAKLERYQAEALVHRHVPLNALAGIVCHGPSQEADLTAELTRRGLSLKIVVRPDWYC